MDQGHRAMFSNTCSCPAVQGSEPLISRRSRPGCYELSSNAQGNSAKSQPPKPTGWAWPGKSALEAGTDGISCLRAHKLVAKSRLKPVSVSYRAPASPASQFPGRDPDSRAKLSPNSTASNPQPHFSTCGRQLAVVTESRSHDSRAHTHTDKVASCI